MKRFIVIPALLLSFSVLFAQRGAIGTDIFGTLQYRSADGGYKASLEKNIFDDLIFTDSRSNKLQYEKKYLDKIEPGLRGNKDAQARLLRRLVRENNRHSDYSATFKVDIFDKTIIEDNKGYKLEEGKDIFGHINVEEQVNGSKTQLKRNLQGGLEYIRDKNKASFGQDIFDKWIYKDSFGNEIQFSKETWKRIMEQYGTDEEFFWELLDRYFYSEIGDRYF
ncbi:hypothetical protein FAZ15_11605 [Sphingobacterium olei]|uniref:Uncharacterized protein n=1 Tax=Sphingobacterium olei TaxID=2571155 RepID=A0A4U0P0A7_9SPHI|nr:hypothetical protein [Sphingobacterium olei]TJZ60631.1 hypothetical protein FAZ15_11605 [Sphingobacterium olei]